MYEDVPHGSADFPIGVHTTVCERGFALYPHTHREFEFLMLKSGSGIMNIDGCEYKLKAGEGVFVNSNSLHFGERETNERCVFFAIVFSPEIFGSFGSDLIMNKYVSPLLEKKMDFPAHYTEKCEWQREVLEGAEEVYNLAEERKSGFELSVKAILMNMWRLCFEHGTPASASSGDILERMKAAMEFMHREYASPLTLADIASETNMSREYFCRSFSKTIHMTPYKYLNRIRIDNSCAMIQTTNLPIGEIAQRCGFNSFSYFSKRFKEYIGCTPTEYVKKYRE
ncbi:MAG: AraC family transcriptional regulator [Clostridia bacterium]|nr:AraC family transcriptional regulator [Clostridia bacterium]